MTCYLTVDETCCNPSGNAHGGFFAWLVDHCSSLAVLALSGPGGKWVTSGVSTNLQLYYTGAAPVRSRKRFSSSVVRKLTLFLYLCARRWAQSCALSTRSCSKVV